VASLMTPLMRVEWLEDRTLLSAVSWTGGGNDNLWNDGKNWSTGSVPHFADDVTISAAAGTTIQVATTSVAIHSLSTNAAISVADHLRQHLVAELANECRSVLLGHVATHRDRS
jgi:lactam utilization protein B